MLLSVVASVVMAAGLAFGQQAKAGATAKAGAATTASGATVEIDRKMGELMSAHRWREAEQVARGEFRRAMEAGDWRQAARMEYGLCRVYQGRRQYSQVLEAGLRGRELALRAKAYDVAAFNGFCIALIYFGTNNYQLGVEAARQMLEDARRGKVKYLFFFSTLYGVLLGSSGQFEESLQVFRESLDEADQAGRVADMAEALDRMGVRYLESGSVAMAETYLLEAYRLRALLVRPRVGTSYYNLARLWLKQGKHREAIRFAGLSRRHSTEEARIEQAYLVEAQAQLALGETRGALENLRRSVGLIRRMRGRVPFGDELQVSLENRTQEIYELYALTAASEYEATRDRRLLEESLTAAQENRAMSLRTRSEAEEGWQARLPDEYWRVSSQLQRIEVKALASRSATGASESQALRLRQRLSELESLAGLPEGERTVPPRGPAAVAGTLASDELLLTFLLAEPVSLRWMQSRDGGLRLARLPGRNQVQVLSERFSRAVEEGRSEDAASSGRQLHAALFAGVPEQGLWTVVPDGTLFQVPLAALPSGNGYLVERVAIRLAPTALFRNNARGGSQNKASGFVGIGDPVSNLADSRLAGRGIDARARPAPAAGVDLSRLPQSAAEVERCARLWNASGQSQQRLLFGTEIDDASVRAALQLRPAVLHLATHVYRPSSAASPVITLGYGGKREWAVLTEREIASLYPAPDLVTLSGCGSGSGPLAPGTGLLGLTRAWLMAGARVVLATRWAVRDDSGQLLGEYYRQLRASGAAPSSREAAQALRNAQVAAIRGTKAGSGLENWGAYFVIGAI